MIKQKYPKRKDARAEVDWPVTVAGDLFTIQGRIKNISRGGALLYMPEDIEVHEQIRLAVEIPEFDDVISAKAEVVRTFSVIMGRRFTSFGVGVKFTEISDEDLRYFTGNLAPEWQEGFEDTSVLSRPKSGYVKQILYGVSAIFLVFIIFYVLQLGNSDQIENNQIVELENRMNLLEEQFAVIKTSNLYGINLDDQASKIHLLEKQFAAFKTSNSYRINLDDQVIEIQNQLVDMQGEFETFATVEKLQNELKIVESKLKEINRPVELSEKTGQTIHLDKTKQAIPLYYYVKKEDSLYRIGIRYGLSVDSIRALNSIAHNEIIQPGQKIIIGWK